MNEVQALEARLRDLEDKFLTLVSCVEYDAAQPYNAELVRLGLTGDERRTLLLIIVGILARAKGQPMRLAQSSRLSANVDVVFQDAPISRDEAVTMISKLMQISMGVAERLLVAHRDSGLGAEGHAALGT